MLRSRKLRVRFFLFALAAALSTPPGYALGPPQHHRSNVACELPGSCKPRLGECGTRGYARVFIGTIRSLTETSDTERVLVLVPDEVFLGDPANEVTVVTNQTCLPGNRTDIQVGDQWLFFLQSAGYPLIDHSATKLVLPFCSPSKPLSEAQDDIETLRHLAHLKDSAIIAGYVNRIGPTYDKLNPTPVSNRRIIVKSDTTGLEYTTFTNVNGHYEFELPPGTYEVTANTDPGLREADDEFRMGGTYISSEACLNVDFTLLTDGKLAGRITTGNGKPAKFVAVSILRIDPIGAPATVVTDADGDFELAGRQPGNYIVGIGLLAPYDSDEWKSRVYYPGVRTKEEAMIIQLGDGEWRTNIDFKLPSKSRAKRGANP